jgi:F-type H+-transporting ATPase subunit a
MSLAVIPVFLAKAFEKPTTHDFVWDCWGPSVKVGGVLVCMNFVFLLLLIAMAAVFLMFFTALRRPKVVPGRWQALVESGIDFVRQQVVLQMIGPEGEPFLPFLATLFFFIFFGNILEIIPGVNFPLNSRLAFPLVMALVAWVVYNAVGVRRHGLLGYLKMVSFPPGAPKVMYLLLTPIEFFSVIVVRPFTLTVRLTANMIAGHFLLAVFFLGTVVLLTNPVSAVFGVFSGILALVLVGFEIFVSALQAFIFAVLTASYIAGALAAEH